VAGHFPLCVRARFKRLSRIKKLLIDQFSGFSGIAGITDLKHKLAQTSATNGWHELAELLNCRLDRPKTGVHRQPLS
jgi:hypothetical protein